MQFIYEFDKIECKFEIEKDQHVLCLDQKLKNLHKHDCFEVIWCLTQWKPNKINKINDDITRRWGIGRWTCMWIVIKTSK